MKQFLLSIFLIIGYHSFSQVTCTVSPADTTVCFRDSIVFTTTVSGLGPFTYKWLKNDVVIPTATDSILVFPFADYSDTAVYLCIVSNGTFTDTSNTGRLRMHTKIVIDSFYRSNSLSCPGDLTAICKGQFKFQVSGGLPPYTYDWGGGNQHPCNVITVSGNIVDGLQVDGLHVGAHTFTVTDSNKCSVSRSYIVDVWRLPKIDFTKDPKDTVYLTKPTVTVSFPDSSEKHLTFWEWDFGDSTATVPKVNPASHAYSKTGKFTIKLNYKENVHNCDTSVSNEITVKQAKLKIPNVFTPDDNDINETFIIKLEGSELEFSEVYLSNELQILDRWGRKVYSKTDYKSGEWDGEKLSDGVYYYILKCHGYYEDEVFKGSVTILRAH